MTTEDQIQTILASLPYFVKAGPDDNSKVLYGCITTLGRASFVVDEREMFSGQPDGSNAEQMEAWRHDVYKRIGKLRGELLGRSINIRVTEEMKQDVRMQEFVWRALHGSGQATEMTIKEFREAFKPPQPCVTPPDVASTPAA